MYQVYYVTKGGENAYIAIRAIDANDAIKQVKLRSDCLYVKRAVRHA